MPTCCLICRTKLPTPWTTLSHSSPDASEAVLSAFVHQADETTYLEIKSPLTLFCRARFPRASGPLFLLVLTRDTDSLSNSLSLRYPQPTLLAFIRALNISTLSGSYSQPAPVCTALTFLSLARLITP